MRGQYILPRIFYLSVSVSIKKFLQTGGDDLVDLDSPGWLPCTEICGNLILAWTMFPNFLPIVYYGLEGADSWRYAPLSDWCMLQLMIFILLLCCLANKLDINER